MTVATLPRAEDHRAREASERLRDDAPHTSVVHHHITFSTGDGTGGLGVLGFFAGILSAVFVVTVLLGGITAVAFKTIGRIDGYVSALANQNEEISRRLEAAEMTLEIRPPAPPDEGEPE